MAQDDGVSWWSSWTSGILENVREKTSTALEFVQNDLSEFVTTIQHDASVVIADSATAVNSNLKVDESEKDAPTGKLKQGFSDLLTSISTTLHQAAESSSEAASSHDDSTTGEQRIRTGMMPVYDRTQVRLQEMQTNPETYCSDSDDEACQEWRKTFDLDTKKGEISELLVNNPDVRRLYTKFVPSVQSHSTFWHRYFYKVHQLELENKRLADIVARASQSESHEQDLGWDDEDDDDDEDLNVSSSVKETEVHSTADSNVVTDSVAQHDIVEQADCTTYAQESEPTTLSPEQKTTKVEDSLNDEENPVAQDESRETKTIDGNSGTSQTISSHNEIEKSENNPQSSAVASCRVETKSEEYKSDSSDSNSWIRVSDKEGSSTNSSSSVVVVNEKETEQLTWDDNDDEDKDDDDDDLDLNEDISNEDVEKLVQSITANELDSEEEWEDWE